MFHHKHFLVMFHQSKNLESLDVLDLKFRLQTFTHRSSYREVFLENSVTLSNTQNMLLNIVPLKLVSAIFIKFLFLQNVQNYQNNLKSSFCSRDIHIFVFPFFPLFLPVGHCLRGWSKINLKVYDAISCLNKNSITHFVWYLEKEKRYDIETLSIDGVSNKKHFYGKIMQKMCTKS